MRGAHVHGGEKIARRDQKIAAPDPTRVAKLMTIRATTAHRYSRAADTAYPGSNWHTSDSWFHTAASPSNI